MKNHLLDILLSLTVGAFAANQHYSVPTVLLTSVSWSYELVVLFNAIMASTASLLAKEFIVGYIARRKDRKKQEK